MWKQKSAKRHVRYAVILIWSRTVIGSWNLSVFSIGGKKTIIRMKVQRYKCMNDQCSYDRQERIPFATGSCNYFMWVMVKVLILYMDSGKQQS